MKYDSWLILWCMAYVIELLDSYYWSDIVCRMRIKFCRFHIYRYYVHSVTLAVSIAGSLTTVTLTRHRNSGGPSHPLPVIDYQLKIQLVAEHLRATVGSGKLGAQVVLDCGVGWSTVKRILSKLRPGSSLVKAPRSVWPRTLRTSRNVEAVAQSIKDNPRQSIRDWPRDLAALIPPWETKSTKIWAWDPAHTTNTIQRKLMTELRGEAHFWRKEMWPPQSPDLNSLDYFFWGILQERVHGTSYPNMESLKAHIAEAWAFIASACRSLQSHVEAVVSVKGSYTA